MFAARRDIPMPGDDRKFELITKPGQAIPLVVDQRLKGADVQHRSRWILMLQEMREDGQESGFGFPCSRRGRDDDILVCRQERGDGPLLGVPQGGPALGPDPTLDSWLE
ncbi:hypothetical protein D9M71_187070 [compost metagenome]